MRAPHRATRKVVELEGSPAARELYAAFRQYNRRHFGGKLLPPLILITQPGSPRSEGDYVPQDEHGLQSRIRIAPRVIAKGDPRLRADVLLHELIHAWAHEVEHDTEPSYRGHGPLYAEKCNQIGKRLKLPPVGVKGRHGLPDCAHWPLNVRPPGYYLEPWTAPTRRTRPKAEAKQDDGLPTWPTDEETDVHETTAARGEPPRPSLEAARGAMLVLQAVREATPVPPKVVARWNATIDHLRALADWAELRTFGAPPQRRLREVRP